MKKTNNQGFSLVELIIVIAIMAVLIGVLAPQFIKYVEKSRAQKDASAVEEIRNAAEIALSEEVVYNEMGTLITATDPVVINIPINGALTVTPITADDLLKSVKDSIGSFKLSSKKYSAGTTVTVSANSVSGSYTVSSAIMP